MFNNTAKPVDLIVVEPTRIDGEHYDAGTHLKQVPPDLAMELAAAGRARVATDELVAHYKQRAKDAKAQAERDASRSADAAAAGDARMAGLIAAAVAETLKAAGVSAAKPA